MRGDVLRFRGRPWIRRGLFGAAAGCLVLAVVASGADAQSSDDGPTPPDIFAGFASSEVASVELEREGLLPIADLFKFIALDGQGTFESSNQEARASLLFPGNGLILGPGLACSQIPPEAPPEFRVVCNSYSYPLTVFADALHPDQSTDGSVAIGVPTDPVSMRGGGARAHAADDGVTTDAELSDLRVLGMAALGSLPLPGLDTSVLRIEDAVSRTSQRIDENGALVVEATSTLSGVSIGAGLVRIGSLVSTARLVDPPDGDPVPETSFEVSGVSVAGTPATITEDGLVLGEPQSQVTDVFGQLQAAVTEALGALGIRFTLLPEASEVTAGGSSDASVGGLLIELTVPVTGLPSIPTPIPTFSELDLNGDYTGSIQLGSVAVGSLASTFPDRVARPRPAASGVSGSSGAPASRPVARPSGPSAAPPAAAATPAPAANPATPEAPEVATLIDDLLPDRIALLYLSFTLAALACCIAPRLTLPHRLPGPSPS